MTLSDEYSRTAQRSAEAADTLRGSGFQECAAFYSYHTFESIGSALIASRGQPVSSRHKAKINAFTNLSRGRSYNRTVAELGQQLISLRNSFLYPVVQPGGITSRPEDVLTVKQAEKLLKRVRGLVRRIKRDL